MAHRKTPKLTQPRHFIQVLYSQSIKENHPALQKCGNTHVTIMNGSETNGN